MPWVQVDLGVLAAHSTQEGPARKKEVHEHRANLSHHCSIAMQCDYDIRQLKIVGTARLNRYRFIKVIC